MKREERFRRLQELGCIACRKMGRFARPDIHHLNLGGHAGQKRRGDEFTIPLCPAHHRGVFWREEDHGPSLAIHPNRFRREFGSDDALLAEVNALIGAAKFLEWAGVDAARTGADQTAEYCLAETVEGRPLDRCANYPRCPCGGRDGWP